jgi:hypothetical protein
MSGAGRATVATAAVLTKSSLKKANCGDSKCAAKGNVQLLDLLGKDLTEVKEFKSTLLRIDKVIYKLPR